MLKQHKLVPPIIFWTLKKQDRKKNLKNIKRRKKLVKLKAQSRDSFIFESYKTGLIFTLLFHCFTICSDIPSFHLELDRLRQIFKFNNYPVTLLDQCVKTLLNEIFVPKRALITVPKKYILTVLPFLGQFSLNLRSR